ncbi:MAG TPA: hypothetical protein VM577_04550 [Anaerovoracaceae bacterium]|nr:hypothetical protein [Anaerovoracaceae bacterium]
MIELHSTHCCGLMEINNLSHANGPEDALKSLADTLRTGYKHPYGFNGKYNFPVPYVLFTGVTKRVIKDHASGRVDNYGEVFAKYLEANGLGTVTRSEERANWTGNTLKVWIWHPNYDNLFRHLELLE